MFSVKFLISAAAAAMLSTTAFAADMPQPQPVYQPVVAEPCCSSAWYLRGDVGIGLGNTFDITYLPSPPDVGNGFQFTQHSAEDTAFFDVGAGYEVNNWLRLDATATYRNSMQINAHGFYAPTTGDNYQGFVKSWVFLANAYVDLGTWDCITPFIGAGVGTAFNQMANLQDTGIGTTGAGFGRNSTNWSLAYAFYAGLDYAVTRNFSVELAYRYLNYGSVTDTIDCVGGCSPDSYKFSNLSSNDIMLGMRWKFPVDSGFVTSTPIMMQPAPAPVMPSPPQYPQPQYPQPQYPLSTRG
jgi:opacity protein-like surface antigen